MEQSSRTADPAATGPEAGPWAPYPYEPGEARTHTDPALVGPADDDLDLLAERAKPGRLTYVLVGLIAAGLVFLGGVWAQKHFGSSSASTRAGAFAAAGGANRAEGFGAGGFGGTRGGEGFGAGGFAGAGAGGGTASGTSGSASAVPVVVGTVTRIAGTTMTVENLGGKSVTVKVPSTATISIKAGKSLTGAGLRKGATVSVSGSTSSGVVTATSVSVTS